MHILFANCMDWAALFFQINGWYGVLEISRCTQVIASIFFNVAYQFQSYWTLKLNVSGAVWYKKKMNHCGIRSELRSLFSCWLCDESFVKLIPSIREHCNCCVWCSYSKAGSLSLLFWFIFQLCPANLGLWSCCEMCVPLLEVIVSPPCAVWQVTEYCTTVQIPFLLHC